MGQENDNGSFGGGGGGNNVSAGDISGNVTDTGYGGFMDAGIGVLGGIAGQVTGLGQGIAGWGNSYSSFADFAAQSPAAGLYGTGSYGTTSFGGASYGGDGSYYASIGLSPYYNPNPGGE